MANKTPYRRIDDNSSSKDRDTQDVVLDNVENGTVDVFVFPQHPHQKDQHHQQQHEQQQQQQEPMGKPFLRSSSSSSLLALSAHLSPGMVTSLIVISWYLCNIGVLLSNKYLLSSYGFRFPVFLTLCHMCACCAYSYVAIERFEVVPMQYVASPRQLLKILMLATIFCLSVVLGNMSLRFIPVSFNQAIGATTPAFTALFLFLITWKTEALATYLTLVPVVAGIVIASNSEPSFHFIGVVLCFASTAGRALKSVVQGLLLTDDSEKLHSMNLLLYMSPFAVLLLLPASLLIEGNVVAVVVAKARENPWILLLLLANATLAYLTNLTNFLVTKHTSALTLQVLGNAKGAVAAVVSVMVFKNPVTAMGCFGFMVTVGGVYLYGESKKRSSANK